MSRLKKLYVYGANYFDLYKLIDAINRNEPTYDFQGFLHEYSNIIPEDTNYPIIRRNERISFFTKKEDNYFVVNTTGNWNYMRKKVNLLKGRKGKFVSLIHPDIDMNLVEVGNGCILPEGCVVGGNTKIGDFVTMRLKCLVSHDVVIEDYVFLGPGASIGGEATLKRGCFIGMGAVVMGGVTIGEGSTVGAGAVVTKDVAPGEVVVGVPAKPISKDKKK